MENKVLDIKTAERMASVSEYFFSKKQKEIDALVAQGKEVISLGIGGPDLPPHKDVIDTLCKYAQMDNTHSYQPSKGIAPLRNAFAKWYKEKYNVEVDGATEVLQLVGSKEGLMQIFMTYLDKGDKVLIPNPGYPTYRAAANLSGADCVEYLLKEEEGWLPNFEEIEKAGVEGVKMMVCNYPNMPTGTLPKREVFEQIVAFGKKHNILIIHDNPYSFTRNKVRMSMLSVPGAKSHVVEFNSLSKSHNMAGWRIGVVVGAKERIDDILCFKSNMDSGSFNPMQMSSVTALELADEWYDSLNEIYYERQEVGYKIMDALGCTYSKEQAGLFIWGRMPAGSEDCFTESDKILYGCGVFITPGGIFGSQGDDFLRISLCAPVEKLEKALAKIKEFKGIK
ncbi:MAG: aminotransferase class I/II-fold pyridoxal phosphate-dependent enzyme [Rikenellaceae bacterium]|nr:aminotransferase class I/II-fold pyridoxal phosphate-dependent enzyme [Rikenellaceae bacterium]